MRSVHLPRGTSTFKRSTLCTFQMNRNRGEFLPGSFPVFGRALLPTPCSCCVLYSSVRRKWHKMHVLNIKISNQAFVLCQEPLFVLDFQRAHTHTRIQNANFSFYVDGVVFPGARCWRYLLWHQKGFRTERSMYFFSVFRNYNARQAAWKGKNSNKQTI